MLQCRLSRLRFSFRRKPSPSAATAVHRRFPSDFVPADVWLTKRSVLKMRPAAHSEPQFITNRPRKLSDEDLHGIQDRLAEVINFGKAFTGQGGQACKRAGAAKQGEADVQEGRTGRPAAPRA